MWLQRSFRAKSSANLGTLKRCFSSVDEKEVRNFNRFNDWWKDQPSMKPLHAYNKLRVQFIREYLLKDKMPDNNHEFFRSLKALDVGSGGGLLSESLGRLGCQVLGIDPTATSVKIAREHLCHDLELLERVSYKQTTIEELVGDEKGEYKNHFDFAVSMEVIEHVNNPEVFVRNIVKAIKPDGLLFMSTIAKTFESWALTVRLSEDVLGLVPQGTHEWEKFIDPEKLQEIIEDCG